MAQFSLRHLLLAVVFSAAAVALLCGDLMYRTNLPSGARLVVGLVAIAVAAALFARSKSPAVAAVLSWPLLVILNWIMFLIAVGYAFDSRDAIDRALGPIATIFATPVAIVQNAVPLGGVWDTIAGLIVVSLLEVLAVAAVVLVLRRKLRSSTESPS